MGILLILLCIAMTVPSDATAERVVVYDDIASSGGAPADTASCHGSAQSCLNPELVVGPPDGLCCRILGFNSGTLVVYWNHANPSGAPYVIRLHMGPVGVNGIRVSAMTGENYVVGQTEDWEILDVTFWIAPPPDLPYFHVILQPADRFNGVAFVDAIEIVDPTPGEAFEVVSATFDQSVYQSGVDTAQLTVVTRSNWGFGESLALSGDASSPSGDRVTFGPSLFALVPGESVESVFLISLPDVESPTAFSLDLELRAEGDILLRQVQPMSGNRKE